MASEDKKRGTETIHATGQHSCDEIKQQVDDHVKTGDHHALRLGDTYLCQPLGPLVTYHFQLIDLESEIEKKIQGNLKKDVNHNDAITMPGDKVITSVNKAPKKLFDEASEVTPELSLKDYEDKNLREFARERRRIIDNQVVRRKKFEYWAFASSVDETNETWLETLRHFEDSSPSSLTSEPEIKAELVNGFIKEDDVKLLTEKPAIGTVDSASIIQNKEKLRLFWERRIMAEQDCNSEPVRTVEDIDDTPPDSLNGDTNETVAPTAAIPEKAEEKPVEEKETVETTAPENSIVSEKETPPQEPSVQENPTPEIIETAVVDTSIDMESGEGSTSVKNEVQETPKEQEQVEKDTPQTEPETPVAQLAETQPEVLNVETGEVVELPAKTEAAAEETPASAPVVDEPETKTEAATPSQSAPQEEQTLSAEPEKTSVQQSVPEENATNKPQIIGETYHHVTKPQPSAPKVPAVVLKKSIPSPTERIFKAESKIALEIQEMQKREEELKKMRERIVGENTVKTPPESSHSEGGSVHSDDSLGPSSPPESLCKSDTENISRPLLIDSVQNGQTYNIGYAFGRKDNVKVKPLVHEPEEEKVKPEVKPTQLKETPIEKEIRIAREREEELRKEKGLQVDDEQQESLVRPTSLGINKPRLSLTKSVGDTQRSLATSRIQLEIEEQTEREKSLRASGVIKTISQERTDSRVTGRLGELTNGDSEKAPLSPVSSNGDKSASPVFTNTNGSSSPVNGKMNGSVKTPSPSNSVSSSPLNGNTAGRRFSNPPPGRGVNMQRFISSKGKDVAFKKFNGNGLEKSSSLVALNNDVYELKPPQVPVQNMKLNQRRSVSTAGPRIQEELKEMQEREDELKKQRARMIGLSQPNLSIVGTEENEVTNGHDEKPSLDRSSSNPNLLENGENEQNGHVKDVKEEKNAAVVGPRRRSTLIDQWEQRIQKSDIKA